MKRALFVAIFSVIAILSRAQTADSLQQAARAFMRAGDYPNAIVVLGQANKQFPDNMELEKDLAFCYYLQKNYSASVETGRKLIARKDADEQCYQILGMAYTIINQKKDADKMYKQGLKKFPASGALNNEYGEMLWANQNPEAIRFWEKGIEVDPNYPSNYYNAAKYYYLTFDKVWTLIYGEMFVNLESYSKRTPEIKALLVEGYKKLFTDLKTPKSSGSKNPFTNAYFNVVTDQGSTLSLGISTESLNILRNKFILEWFDKYAGKYPFRLFDYQQQLMKNGLSDAYNQWLFGAALGLPVFQSWTTQHADEYNRFITFQKGRVFKVPGGQYYRNATGK